MSLLKANAVQLGQSLTASQNFTWYQPASPDGTVRLGNGNSGSVTDLVTLTSAGNLGIGTSSPGQKLVVSGSGAQRFDIIDTGGATGRVSTANGTVYVGTTTNHPLAFFTNDSVKATLDSSGNLGLGVTPSAASLPTIQSAYGLFTGNSEAHVARNAYFNSSWIYASSSTATRFSQAGGQFQWFTAPSGTAGNAISFTQAMTLDASGNLLVGRTNNNPGYTCKTVIDAGDTVTGPIEALGTYRSALSAIGHIGFFNPNGRVGEIYTSASTTNYATSSDQRLKKNIVDAPSALSSVNAIKVRSFDWKSDGAHVDYGYIAQELLDVVPEAVSVPADPEEMMGVDFGKLTPRLVKAIQELSAELNLLKQKVNA